MRDPYDVLGVQRSAKPAAIKSAFRRLAKKLHPDANRDDPKATERFAEINSAHEDLGDEAKRKAFDASEIDAEGKPVHRLRRVRRATRRRLRPRWPVRDIHLGTGRLRARRGRGCWRCRWF
jgi:curved DNA-binding protein CbpA